MRSSQKPLEGTPGANGFVCPLQAAGYPRWAYFSYPIYMQSVNWSTAESLVRNSEADREEHSFVSNIVTKSFSLNTQNEKQKPQLGLSTSCSATFWNKGTTGYKVAWLLG